MQWKDLVARYPYIKPLLLLGMLLITILCSIAVYSSLNQPQVSISSPTSVALSGVDEIVSTSDKVFISDILRKQLMKESGQGAAPGNVMAEVRKDSITNELSFNGPTTSFLVDIADAERTYKLTLLKHDEDDISVFITCASKSERRYNNLGCKEFQKL